MVNEKFLLEFIEKASNSGEFDLFIKMFNNLPKEKFAVVKVSGKTLEKNMDVFAENIALLNKVGIYPWIVHGGGSLIDKKLPNSKKVNGLRVTSKQEIETIVEIFEILSLQLEKKINEKGGSAKKVWNVFECEKIDSLGAVGKISELKLGQAMAALKENCSPIISPIGKSGCEKLNINADSAAKEIVKAIEPKKFIFVTETGGILNSDNEVIPFLNIFSKDAFENLSGGMLLKVKEIKDFLKTGIDCEVVITSPHNLLKEIFTIKGSGTFIKYHKIKSCSGFSKLNKDKIKSLLEDSFGKQLSPGYFDDKVKEVLYQKDYDGIAVIKSVDEIPYLDKFAVAKHCQGTGLGKSLWQELVKKNPKMVWRSNPNNTINTFYTKNCNGMIQKNLWNIYWRNLEENEIINIVDLVAKKESTLVGK